MKTRTVHIEGIGDFVVPAEPEARSRDSEGCIKGVCGRYDPELARSIGEYGTRCGREYSYMGRRIPENVRVVIDVGCNLGAYIVWACRDWWPGTVETVHAYDPNPLCIELARENAKLVQSSIEVKLHCAAISLEAEPLFTEDVRLGCSRTYYGRDERVAQDFAAMPGIAPRRVPAIHPRDLPPADAMKCDAEGVDADIFDHYPHGDGLKVAQFEWHEPEHRERMFAACRRWGLTLAKNDCGDSEQGVACWVRR